MPVELAVNYSTAAADLLHRGRVAFDRFKCPAWPDLVASVQGTHPGYIHFPLRVGAGIGDAVDAERNQPADWRRVEDLLRQTETPLVNVHLMPEAGDHPGIDIRTTAPAVVARLTDCLIRDLEAVVKHFGPERVVAENDTGNSGSAARAVFLPEVIGRVLQATGCGLLLDLSHARLCAGYLSVDARAYVGALPVERIREIHVSGVQPLTGHWLERLQQADGAFAAIYGGQLVDHLPLTGEDWDLVAWAMERIRSGAWGRPWVVTMECGGVGPLWEAATDPAALAEQIPRLHTLVTAANAPPSPAADCLPPAADRLANEDCRLPTAES